MEANISNKKQNTGFPLGEKALVKPLMAEIKGHEFLDTKYEKGFHFSIDKKKQLLGLE